MMRIKKVSLNEEERVIQTFTVKPEDSEDAKRRQTRGSKGVTRGKSEDLNSKIIFLKHVNLKDIKIAGRHGA